MKIPSRFKIGGLTIEVKSDPKKRHDDDTIAHASYRNSEIVIMPSTEEVPRPQDLVEQDFCHELVHFISYHAGDAVNHELKEMLHRNEGFINLFSMLLHQVLTSMEYD